MKKLSLNKEFITSLDQFEMTHVHGGNVGNGTGMDDGGGGNPEEGPVGWLSLVGIFLGPWGGGAAGLLCCMVDEFGAPDAHTSTCCGS